jgi:ribosome-associated translation inhibitor RaiA
MDPMQVQVSTDNHVDGSQALIRRVEEVVQTALDRFGDRVTRVEVHFSDENSSAKGDEIDKRCAIEARLAGLPPMAVTHQAPEVDLALTGAVEKLARTLTKTLGRIKDNHFRETPRTS